MDEIGSEIPFDEIWLTVLSKPLNFHYKDEINIGENDTLEKNLKRI